MLRRSSKPLKSVKVQTQAMALVSANGEGLRDREDAVPGYDSTAWATTTVMVIGAGGLGGEVSAILARKGVGGLTIFDPDIVEPSNLNRQRFYPQDVGQPKAVRLANNLKAEATGNTTILGYPWRFEEVINLGLKLSCEVAVCAVDNDATRAFCARYFWEHQTPCIMLGVSEDAGRGYVFVQELGKACWCCWHPGAETNLAVNRCAGATPDILHVVAGVGTYAIDSLIMPRKRRWNYKEVFLAGDLADGHRWIEPSANCSVCRGVTP